MEAIERKILDQLRQLRAARQSVSNEKQWIEERLSDDHLQAILPQLSIVSLHIMTALLAGELTGVDLADRLHVTRGGITRAAKGLRELELIKSRKHPEDKKKIYYSLTTDGRKIAIKHREMHEMLNERFARQISQRYSRQQLELFSKMLAEVQKMEDEIE